MVMHLRINAPQWVGDRDDNTRTAKCVSFAVSRYYDPWFDTGEADEAIRICNGDDDGAVCPLRTECLLFALVNNESNGVWGGMHERDRKYLRAHYKRDNWRWFPPGQLTPLPVIPEVIVDDELWLEAA
ncbi:WhiB family transcriptional regulator [Actinomadura atramentaria]|uniref:WhiB family transcriptional regulator n=1 Tax=Actinomadura atramentaria TaxID=1990 RepID=UPI0003619636|nr:WhiB family transcriptional regulator [Actinomadura atramentaria]